MCDEIEKIWTPKWKKEKSKSISSNFCKNVEKPIYCKKSNHFCKTSKCYHFMDNDKRDSKLSVSLVVYSSDENLLLSKANDLNSPLKESFLDSYVTNVEGGDTAALMIPVMCKDLKQDGDFDVVKFRKDMMKSVISYLDETRFTNDHYPNIMTIVNDIMGVSYKLPPRLSLYGNVSGSPVWDPTEYDIEIIGRYSCVIADKKEHLSDTGMSTYIMDLCEKMEWKGGFLMQIITPRSAAVKCNGKYQVFNDIVINTTANGKARTDEIACKGRICKCPFDIKKRLVCPCGNDIESMKLAALRELEEETTLVLEDKKSTKDVEYLGCWGEENSGKYRFYSLDLKNLK